MTSNKVGNSSDKMPHPVLEQYLEGVITSASYPPNRIQELIDSRSVIDINVEHMFRTLLNSINRSSGAQAPQYRPQQSKNPLDQVISRLERQYAGSNLGNIKRTKDTGKRDQTGQISDDEHPANDNTTAGKKRRKRTARDDEYDISDPFVDDSELIEEFESAIVSEKTRTKHDGFFVSSGKLQVLSPSHAKSSDMTQTKVVKPRKPRAPNSSKPESSGSQLPTKPSIENEGNFEPIPVQIVSDHYLEPIPTDVDFEYSDPIAAPAQEDCNSEVVPINDIVKRQRQQKPRPPITFSDEALAYFEEFKSKFSKYGLSLKKNSKIPQYVQNDLHELDSAMIKLYTPSDLENSTGYYETLQEILGKDFLIYKVRSLFKKRRTQEELLTLSKRIDLCIAELQKDMIAHIAPCPKSRQPGYLQEKRQQKKERESQNAGQDQGTIANALSPDGDSKVSSTLELGVLSPQSPIQSLSQSQHNEPSQEDVGDAIKSDVVQEDVKICNWTPEMKVKFIQIHDLIVEYVATKNRYRKKLTSEDKSSMTPQEYEEEKEENVLNEYYRRICSVLPASCRNGDTSYLKRVINKR